MREHLACLVHARAPLRALPVGARPGAHLLGDVLERALLREDAQLGALLQRGGHRLREAWLGADKLHHLLVRRCAHRFEQHDHRHVVGEGVMPQRVRAVLVDDVRLRLALVRRRGDGGVDVVLGVAVDDDPVLRELLLDENHLLLPLDDEVAARVNRALAHPRQLRVGTPMQHALLGAEHDRHPADLHALLELLRRADGVLDVHLDDR
mmetsp:Transcript_43056/g.100904  ORF Transcript_43056/g.100904 Transcript_43056/m.100904 type:complete len:208 (+) Transcript_43056:1242-1865(+)